MFRRQSRNHGSCKHCIQWGDLVSANCPSCRLRFSKDILETSYQLGNNVDGYSSPNPRYGKGAKVRGKKGDSKGKLDDKSQGWQRQMQMC